MHHIKNSKTWIKEAALSLLSSLGMIDNAFGPNLPNIFEILFELVNTFAGPAEYKQLLNQAF